MEENRNPLVPDMTKPITGKEALLIICFLPFYLIYWMFWLLIGGIALGSCAG